MCLAAIASLGLGVMKTADAQAAYPNKPVRLVVSYAPGNVTDLLARIVAERLSEKWGQPVVVDNKAGQGGSLGAQVVAKAPADGYTLLFSAMAALAINPHVYANVGYNVLKDFTPVVSVASPSLAMVVTPSLKISSYKALVDYSKANPNALTYGPAGNGTAPHLNLEALKMQTGLAAMHVPYKSATAAMTDVMGGLVHIQQDSITTFQSQIKTGRLVAIAAGNKKRLPQFPDVPSFAEAMPGFTPIVPWLGILGPAGMPAGITEKVSQDVRSILQQADVQEKLASNGLIAAEEGPQAFGKTIAGDYNRLGKLTRQLAIKVD